MLLMRRDTSNRLSVHQRPASAASSAPIGMAFSVGTIERHRVCVVAQSPLGQSLAREFATSEQLLLADGAQRPMSFRTRTARPRRSRGGRESLDAGSQFDDELRDELRCWKVHCEFRALTGPQ